MRVRLRFDRGPFVQRKKGKNRRAALGAGAFLTPAAVMAGILGIWRLAADLRLAREFGISNGLFSHWQVWLAAAAALQWAAWMLNKYARGHARHVENQEIR